MWCMCTVYASVFGAPYITLFSSEKKNNQNQRFCHSVQKITPGSEGKVVASTSESSSEDWQKTVTGVVEESSNTTEDKEAKPYEVTI